MLSLVEDLHITSPLHLAFASAATSILAGLWKLVIFPFDTFKTVCQVEGIEGLARLVAKVGRTVVALFLLRVHGLLPLVPRALLDSPG